MIIYCDGGSRGNPGPAASAFVVTDDKDNLIASGSKYLDIKTNNFAEYTAVVLATDWLVNNKSNIREKVIFNLDSQLVQRQMTGQYKIKNPDLKKLHDIAVSNINDLGFEVTFVWNFRSENHLADELVNTTLDNKLQRENQK